MISIMKYTSISKFLTLKWSELEECVRNDRGGCARPVPLSYRLQSQRVHVCKNAISTVQRHKVDEHYRR